MSKKKTTAPPSVVEMQPGMEVVIQSEEVIESADREFWSSVVVELPVANLPESHGNIPQRIDAGFLTRQQGVALKRLLRGLDDAGARLQNGKRITHKTDVIRYLLEQVELCHCETT